VSKEGLDRASREDAGVWLLTLGLIAFALLPWVDAGGLWSFETLRWFPACAGLAVLALRLRTGSADSDRQARDPLRLLASPSLIADLVVAGVGFALCWFLRDNSRSGDFGRVVSDIRLGVDFITAEPLSPWMMGRLAALTRLTENPNVASLQFMLCLWGALGFALLRRLALELCSDQESALPAVFSTLLACGSNALLFAHVETYTFSGVLMLAALIAGLKHLRTGASPLWAMGWWTLACAFHMQVLVLAPAMVLLTVWSWRKRSERQVHLLGWLASVGSLVVLQKVCAAHPTPYPQHFGGGDARMLVTSSHLFSEQHLLDVLNELLLVAPLAFPVLIAFGVGWGFGHFRERPPSHAAASSSFLALGVGGWLALVSLWNPDLGAWHDWDLFAGIGWVASAWACSMVLNSGSERIRWWLFGLAALSLARSLPFVWANHLGPVTGLQ
jgi:hypothetical protein